MKNELWIGGVVLISVVLIFGVCDWLDRRKRAKLRREIEARWKGKV